MTSMTAGRNLAADLCLAQLGAVRPERPPVQRVLHGEAADKVLLGARVALGGQPRDPKRVAQVDGERLMVVGDAGRPSALSWRPPPETRHIRVTRGHRKSQNCSRSCRHDAEQDVLQTAERCQEGFERSPGTVNALEDNLEQARAAEGHE